MNHLCQESKTCCCSTQALEPDEECPVHGVGPHPPRCDTCGRFIKMKLEPFRLPDLTAPEPSLCDNCIHAYRLGGGIVWLGDKMYAQRYCRKVSGAITIWGWKECPHFIHK